MSLLPPREVARLSVQERLELISQLWDSLADNEIAVTPAQEAELDRRLASFAEDRPGFVTWEALRAELASRRS